MKFSLSVDHIGREYLIHNVETNGLTMEVLLDRIYPVINVGTFLRSEVIPKLQGIIPLYEEAIDINTDEELNMVVAMYTDTGLKIVKLRFNLEFRGLNFEVMEEEIPQMIETHAEDEQITLSDHEEYAPNTTEEDSDDDLSGYSSSNNVKYHGPSDANEEKTDPIALISDEMVDNYFQENAGVIEKLEVGMTFDDVDHFRRVIRNYAIQEDFPLMRLKNEKTRVTLKCQREGCTWRIHASPVGVDQATYQIKTYNSDHSCDPFGHGCKEVSAQWIAEKMVDDFKTNPFIDLSTVSLKLKTTHGVSVKRGKLYRARQLVLEMVAGDHTTSYANIPDYIGALHQKDTNIFIKLKCTGLDMTNISSSCRFEKLFVCFPAQRDGFKYGCRPFIGIDGCFLKGPYGGQLLVATALDANSGIFPLAVMFAETESTATWSYFLQCLQDYLDDPRCLTFMSDRQKGLLNALRNICPTASTRFCAKHRCDNFQAKFPGPKLRTLYWKAVRATNAIDFKQIMDEMKFFDEAAWRWMFSEDPRHWSVHAFDERVKCNHVTNNMTESFNGWISKIRQLPILSLLEEVRKKCMKRFTSRYADGLKWESDFSPKVREKLADARKKGRHIQGQSNGDEYEVYDDRTYLVNLSKRTCQCGEWDLCGIPCKHAMACIHNKQDDPLQYIHPYFCKEAYLRTYQGKVPTLPDKIMWPTVPHPRILPPVKVMGKDKHGKSKQTWRGRPVLHRRRATNEPTRKMRRSNVVHCRRCKGMNHNWRTCPQRPENWVRNNQRRDGSSNSQVGDTSSFQPGL